LGSCGSCCTNGKSLRAIETLTITSVLSVAGLKSCTNGKSLRAIETHYTGALALFLLFRCTNGKSLRAIETPHPKKHLTPQ